MQIKKFLVLLLSFGVVGCASILPYDKDQKPIVDSQVSEKSFCIQSKKILIVNTSYGQTNSHEPLRHESDLSNALRMELDTLFSSNEKCKVSLLAIVEVINEPVDQKRILGILNMFTIGIIPYWDKENNTLRVALYDERGDLKNSYSSTIQYTRMQSIFLWPVAPFYETGNLSLSQKLLPEHIKNIRSQMASELTSP